MSKLERLCFVRCDVSNLYLPPSVRHLYLDCPRWYIGQWSRHSFPPLDNLETLVFIGSRYPMFFLEAAAKTDSGKLYRCHIVEANKMALHIGRLLESRWFKNVKSLQLKGSRLDDSHAQSFISAFPNLEELSLEDNIDLTGCFFADLMNAPSSKLKSIHMQGRYQTQCWASEVMSRARERGVTITVSDQPGSKPPRFRRGRMAN